MKHIDIPQQKHHFQHVVGSTSTLLEVQRASNTRSADMPEVILQW